MLYFLGSPTNWMRHARTAEIALGQNCTFRHADAANFACVTPSISLTVETG